MKLEDQEVCSVELAKDHNVEITIDNNDNQPKPSGIQVLVLTEQ